MKTEIEYENLLDRAVANNHGEEEVLMALLPCLSLSDISDGWQCSPSKLLTAHSSLWKAREDTPASADCMRCSPMNEHANFVSTGHHFFQCWSYSKELSCTEILWIFSWRCKVHQDSHSETFSESSGLWSWHQLWLNASTQLKVSF